MPGLPDRVAERVAREPTSPGLAREWLHEVMSSGRVAVEIDADLVERAGRAGAPTGPPAAAVVEDAVRAFLGAEVVDTVRARNRGVDPEEIAALARSELRRGGPSSSRPLRRSPRWSWSSSTLTFCSPG
jgi:hypothetical protein